MKRFFIHPQVCLPLLLIAGLLRVTPAISQAQGCDGQRYLDDLTTSILVTTVTFGENVNPAGNTQTLRMDIYEPAVDSVMSRPAIVFAFGGGFVSGNRQQMDLFCRTFAQKGFVTATIDYRIWNTNELGTPDSLDLLNTAFMAVADMKAAVRHLKLDASTTNEYGVDPDRVFVGGISAGAVTSLHLAYVTPDDIVPPFIQTVLDANGGFAGNTGDSLNLAMDSDVIGVINLSGGIYDTAWINQGDVPSISYHGTADEVVPFESGLAAETVNLMGSGLIHQRMEHLGNLHFLRSAEGAGHLTAYLPPFFDDFLQYVDEGTALIQEVLCGTTSNAEVVEELDIQVYPNPASDRVWISCDQHTIRSVRVFDQAGRLVHHLRSDMNIVEVDLTGLAAGMYLIHTVAERQRATRLLMVTKR